MTEAATLSQAIRERRMKLVPITGQYILDLVRAGTDSSDRRILQLQSVEIPNDAFVLNVSYSPENATFLVCIASKEYEPTPEGWCLEKLDGGIEIVNLRDLARELRGPDPVDWTPRRGDVWRSEEHGEAKVLEEQEDGVMLLFEKTGAHSFTRADICSNWTRVSRGFENPNVREIVGTDAEVAKAVADEIGKTSDG